MIGSLGVMTNDSCSKSNDAVLSGWVILLIVLGLPLLVLIVSWLVSKLHRRTRSNR